MEFRHATHTDIERIMEIVRDAQRWFATQGIDQWQDGYPTPEIFFRDIERRECYTICEKEQIIAVCVISFAGEPTYDKIYDGEWIDDEAYVVVHRIAVASSHKGRGVAGRILAHAEQLASERHIRSFRIDTHRDNLPMQRAITKQGFLHCGRILLESGAEREAYQKRI